MEAGIVIPKPELQRRLLALIADGSFRRLHNPRYSVVANPYRDQYQNCTVFVLDLLMAAIYQTQDPAQIAADIKAYFKAQPIAIDPVRLMLGSVFKPELALSDQDGAVRTATFESLAAFMRENGLAQEELTLTNRQAAR